MVEILVSSSLSCALSMLSSWWESPPHISSQRRKLLLEHDAAGVSNETISPDVCGIHYTDKNNAINVERSNVLGGGMRGFAQRSFNGWAKLDIEFADEDGIDTVGPMREIMQLVTYKFLREASIIPPQGTATSAWYPTRPAVRGFILLGKINISACRRSVLEIPDYQEA